MPNLKSLKALRKLMQEEGLLRQVKKIPDGTAYNLENALAIKRNPEKLNDPYFLEKVLPYYRNPNITESGVLAVMQDAIAQARRVRNEGFTTRSGRENAMYPYNSDVVYDYPHHDMELNKKIRKDLEYVSGKENANSKTTKVYDDPETEYEDSFLPPSRRGLDLNRDSLEQLETNRHVAKLEEKWNQLRSLLEKGKQKQPSNPLRVAPNRDSVENAVNHVMKISSGMSENDAFLKAAQKFDLSNDEYRDMVREVAKRKPE